MTTLPPKPQSTFPDTFPAEPHRARQIGEGFGADPQRYDRTRPTYPPALIDRILAASPGREVLDVGIGTGASARPFRAGGCTVIGVEPDARMAEFSRRQGFEAQVAAPEDWDPAGHRSDLARSMALVCK